MIGGPFYWIRLCVFDHGFFCCWCFVSFVIVRDPTAQLISMSVTIGNMVGVAARNYGVDRLVTLQSTTTVVPVM